MELLRRLLRWLNGRPDKVMYIGGSDTLPPPLPRQEEAEWISRLEQGELLAVRSDYVKVGSITYPRILLALTPGAVSDGGGYQALWGGRKERRHGESAAAASAVAQRPAG